MATRFNYAWQDQAPKSRVSRKPALLAVVALAGLAACLAACGPMLTESQVAANTAAKAVVDQTAGSVVVTAVLDNRNGSYVVCGQVTPALSIEAEPFKVTTTELEAGPVWLGEVTSGACNVGG